MDLHNISSVAMISMALYFYYVYSLNFIIAVVFIIFALSTWTYPAYNKQDKKLKQAQVELLKAKTEWYNRRDVK